ncbi:MAG: hypothetical protein ABTQ73_03415 [Caldilineales bacterium]
MRRSTLQAGLFGGALAVLLGIITVLPYVGLCLAIPLFPVVFFLTGIAVVRIAPLPLEVGQAAASGASAGALAGVIGGIAAMFLAPIRLAVAGGAEQAVRILTPGQIEALTARGLDPVAVMDFAGGVGAGLLCCGLQLFTSVLLAGLAAALYAAYRRA